MSRSFVARRVQYVQYAGLALILAVSSTGVAGCKAGKKQNNKSNGSGTTQPTTQPTSPQNGAPAAAADNGLAGKPPKVILAQAAQAVRAAGSMRMKGSKKDGGELLAVDMTLTAKGAKGKLRGPMGGKNVTMEMVFVGGKVYVRGQQLWMAAGGKAMVRKMGNKWKVLNAKGMPGSDFLSLGAMAKGLLKPKGKVVKLKPAMLGGQKVIRLMDGGDHSVMYIAATGKPYPLRMAESGGKNVVNYAQYGAPVTLTPPPNAVKG
ncbi:hypothetical protein J4573_43400 [Actinomadura barringtoniae]|uniref:Lipoprotein n=1 Tax=Actinomadura barringtoniae TaxID=1427535 RepID=A0A939T8C8_9ACTN|nr:hypothetical protein [Actinomadura barringtoniae]MBO2453998.1 hypothetical protein [Actinomadura barringtoniae]